MQITDKQLLANVKPSHNGYELTLRAAGGNPEVVSLHGHLLWDQVQVGETVTGKSWRGKIVTVTGHGYSNATYDYPIVDGFIYRYGVVICTIWLVVIGFYFVKGWRKQGVVTGAQ